MKVVFTTLFLGLVIGTQAAGLEIEGVPHRVVFMVDGVEKVADGGQVGCPSLTKALIRPAVHSEKRAPQRKDPQ